MHATHARQPHQPGTSTSARSLARTAHNHPPAPHAHAFSPALPSLRSLRAGAPACFYPAAKLRVGSALLYHPLQSAPAWRALARAPAPRPTDPLCFAQHRAAPKLARRCALCPIHQPVPLLRAGFAGFASHARAIIPKHLRTAAQPAAAAQGRTLPRPAREARPRLVGQGSAVSLPKALALLASPQEDWQHIAAAAGCVARRPLPGGSGCRIGDTIVESTSSFRSFPSLSSLVALNIEASCYLRSSRRSPTGFVVCFALSPLKYWEGLALARRFGGALRGWYFSDGSSVMRVRGVLVSIPVSGVAGIPVAAVTAIAPGLPVII